MNDAIEAASRHPEPERRPQLHARAASRPKRASRRLVRVWAWALGGLSFLSPLALFGVFPKPAQAAATSSTAAVAQSHRPVVVVITKKIIYTKSASSSISSIGAGPVNYVYAPAAAPVATTCGTHPC
ncbi:MAG: hypothetical protein ACRDH7_06520 [Actinomycetota bacterium]